MVVQCDTTGKPLSLEWMNRDATALICRNCGQVTCFSQKLSQTTRSA